MKFRARLTMGLTNEFRPRISQRPNDRWSKLDTVLISTSSCGLKSYSCIRWSIIVCKITYFEKFYSIMYICYVYEVYMSLHLKSKTRTLFYHILPSSGHVLASSLELWLSRYDDLLHLLCILREQINQALATEIDSRSQFKHSHPFRLCCCGLVTCSDAF